MVDNGARENTPMNLHDLMRNNEHEKIVQLNGREFDSIRTIAYICLGRFDAALKCAEKGSFELAYVFYKLKKYKKALRILRHIETEGSEVLASQCLYYLGYYNTAYTLLSKIKKDNDIVVNLQAMKSLAILADVSQCKFGSKFLVRKMDETVDFEDLTKYPMSSVDGHIDFVFNLSFEKLGSEDEFVRFLEDEVKDDKVKGSMLEEQLKNIKGEFDSISVCALSKSQRETLEFNTRVTDRFSNPLHFQQNFLRPGEDDRIKKHNECLLIEEIYKDGFSVDARKVPVFSPKMMLFRMLVTYKNGHMPSDKVLEKVISKTVSVRLRDVLSVLRNVLLGTEISRDEYIRVLNEISKPLPWSWY